MRRGFLVLWIVGLASLTGCAAVGPKSVVRDRFDYSTALSDSWKNQMVQNIVKSRYADLPIFLEVASITSQYDLKGNATARADSLLGPLTVGGSYSVRPTISYTPLTGERFVKGLMTPLPASIVLRLIESGWPVEFILPLTVQAINGLYNDAGGQMAHRSADQAFNDLVELLASIQRSGVLVFGIEEHDGGEDIVLMFRKHPDSKVQSEIASVLKLLFLEPDTRRIKIMSGICPAGKGEVSIETRSILMMMQHLTSGVEVPSAHTAEVLAAVTSDAEGVDVKDMPLLSIRSGEEHPGDAYAAIKYRHYWFWVENSDVRSKRVLSFLQFLMTVAESGDSKATPVLTLSAGQ
jgi:hypothetical protein